MHCIESYVDKVYAYAIRRTFTEEEAADLSQEILYTALRELPKLRGILLLRQKIYYRLQKVVSKAFR